MYYTVALCTGAGQIPTSFSSAGIADTVLVSGVGTGDMYFIGVKMLSVLTLFQLAYFFFANGLTVHTLCPEKSKPLDNIE